jgi:hypothetical protein
MKTLKKTTLASLVGAAALTVAGAANATIVVGGADGYEFSVDGNINQFFVYTDDNRDNQEETTEIRDGLLPAFLGFNISAPEINGLKIGARVSISPSTNGLAQGAGSMEQREAFGTVDGSFGQILIGKALGLYGSHNILTEQTLFGVGWGTGITGVSGATSNLTTTLGGIGLGYDYADWRSQIKWTSPDMNGFKMAFAVVDPQGPGLITEAGATGPLTAVSGHVEEDSLRYEADLNYAGAFDGGSFSAWVSAAWQDHDNAAYDALITGGAEDAQYFTVGGTLAIAGFEFMAQYSDAEDVVVDTSGVYGGTRNAEWDQYVIQAGYRFAGTTLVSANYSELDTDVDGVTESDDTAERITIGVYHDVNANLKLVAEYTEVEHDDDTRLDADIFSVGGFITW